MATKLNINLVGAILLIIGMIIIIGTGIGISKAYSPGAGFGLKPSLAASKFHKDLHRAQAKQEKAAEELKDAEAAHAAAADAKPEV